VPHEFQRLMLTQDCDLQHSQMSQASMGNGCFERRYHSKKLFDHKGWLSRQCAPRLVLGDFNEWLRGLASHLLETHFNTAEPRRRLGRARSYPGILPLAHVDHIYYDSPLQAVNVSIHRTRLALIASDHLRLLPNFAVNLLRILPIPRQLRRVRLIDKLPCIVVA
jgi:endonuclease/exonuclease/phosphatase family metal-dependent hydrolase